MRPISGHCFHFFSNSQPCSNALSLCENPSCRSILLQPCCVHCGRKSSASASLCVVRELSPLLLFRKWRMGAPGFSLCGLHVYICITPQLKYPWIDGEITNKGPHVSGSCRSPVSTSWVFYFGLQIELQIRSLIAHTASFNWPMRLAFFTATL